MCVLVFFSYSSPFLQYFSGHSFYSRLFFVIILPAVSQGMLACSTILTFSKVCCYWLVIWQSPVGKFIQWEDWNSNWCCPSNSDKHCYKCQPWNYIISFQHVHFLSDVFVASIQLYLWKLKMLNRFWTRLDFWVKKLRENMFALTSNQKYCRSSKKKNSWATQF